MPAGRPTGYKEEYVDKVEEYLEQNRDLVDVVVSDKDKKRSKVITKVSLPTIEGFARFIGVPRRTIYDWRDNFPKFSHTLDKIMIEQQERLINKGLSGDYNSTIAKLILSSNHGMAERKDVTSGDLPIPLLNALPNNNRNKKDTQPDEED